MTEDAPTRDSQNWSVDLSRLLEGQTALLESFYVQSQAGRWGVSRERIAAALERSAKKALAPGPGTPQQLQEYFSALHLEDLALATPFAPAVDTASQHIF